MTERKTDNDKKLTFEQALEKLEQIVSDIEGGEVPLEKSIERYAEGIKLVKQCRSILDQAERKIQMLTQGEDGKMIADGELPDEGAAEQG
jgi:exodeoxyribonuclease VII small subunit